MRGDAGLRTLGGAGRRCRDAVGSELVSLYQYLLPVFATISAVVMGLDHMKWIQIVAMVIIVIGMALTNIGKGHRKAPQSASKR